MITPILNRQHFNDILEKEGWVIGLNDLFQLCPYDPSIRVHRRNGTFFMGTYNGPDYEVIGKITNIKAGNWKFDDITHLISNDLFALRTQ